MGGGSLKGMIIVNSKGMYVCLKLFPNFLNFALNSEVQIPCGCTCV